MYKKIVISVSLFLLIFVSISEAKRHEVLLIPYSTDFVVDKIGYNELIKKIRGNIEKVSGMKYLSEVDFWKKWKRNMEIQMSKTNVDDSADDGVNELGNEIINVLAKSFEENIKNAGSANKLFEVESLFGTLSEHDYFSGIKYAYLMNVYPDKKDGRFKAVSRIINLETGRYKEKLSLVNEENINRTFLSHSGEIMNSVQELSMVYADEVVDIIDSKVQYNIVTDNEKKIRVVLDYTSLRPSPEIQDVKIYPLEESFQNEQIDEAVTAIDNREIKFNFMYEGKKLLRTSVKKDSPEDNIDTPETLRVLSEGDYILRFIFSWQEGKLMNVQIEPEINPYP